jgi:hypothetical protein
MKRGGRNVPLASENTILRNFIFFVRSSIDDVAGRSLVTERPLSEFWLPNDGARESGLMVAMLVAAVVAEAAVERRLKKPMVEVVSWVSRRGKERKEGAYLSTWCALS